MTTARTPLLRSARFSALLLICAAAVGLIVANSPLGPGWETLRETHLSIGIADLSIAHWISDGLLAIFFFTAAVELRQEVTVGALSDRRRAMVPALAALGGVIVPILVFLAIAGTTDAAKGWPVPTATDIAFALGVLGLFGRGLPGRIRAFLLALAILDDIIGIIFIAVLFATDVSVPLMLLAVLLAAAFAVVSRIRRWAALRTVALLVLGAATWLVVLDSGVHATIAGVVLGLVIAVRPGDHGRHIVEPWVNGIILPVFAFAAAAVAIPPLSDGLSAAFWGVLVALPVGKLIGIVGVGVLAQLLLRTPREERLPVGDIVVVGCLGGIGFTVSLLLGELAFVRTPLGAEVTLAVIAGSVISMLLSAIVASQRARGYRRSGQIEESDDDLDVVDYVDEEA